jgi:hypothetical protein
MRPDPKRNDHPALTPAAPVIADSLLGLLSFAQPNILTIDVSPDPESNMVVKPRAEILSEILRQCLALVEDDFSNRCPEQPFPYHHLQHQDDPSSVSSKNSQ